MFTKNQIRQLSDKGISVQEASSQLEIFKKGIEPVKLVRAAIPGDGIETHDPEKLDYYIDLFQKEKQKFTIIKFVPASGAASRMFKLLFESLSEFSNNPENHKTILNKEPQINEFFRDLNNYPFYNDLAAICKVKSTDLEMLLKEGKYAEILLMFLSAQGIGYGELPKGLLKFHSYKDETRTAFEEHFVEAAMYLRNHENKVKIHFTVSPEHKELFHCLADELVTKYRIKDDINFDIGFSVQKPSTDTLAADMNNRPYIINPETLLFRPGGHGALLNNMQDITEDIVFVGNIDNIAPDRTKALRIRYKKLLAGILIERTQEIHNFLKRLEKGFTKAFKTEVVSFVRNNISESAASDLEKLEGNEFVSKAFGILDRPVRVCGMVKNVGEPGGGPFWISDKSGHISKQIVESSQVNLSDPVQNAIFQAATHFNPVDLACFISSYKGDRFNLMKFRDPDMAFIAIKSQGGSSLKALELPGLWNGSMAGWITFFVDVPVETFSPVKTIFDLRREEHIS